MPVIPVSRQRAVGQCLFDNLIEPEITECLQAEFSEISFEKAERRVIQKQDSPSDLNSES